MNSERPPPAESFTTSPATQPCKLSTPPPPLNPNSTCLYFCHVVARMADLHGDLRAADSCVADLKQPHKQFKHNKLMHSYMSSIYSRKLDTSKKTTKFTTCEIQGIITRKEEYVIEPVVSVQYLYTVYNKQNIYIAVRSSISTYLHVLFDIL